MADNLIHALLVGNPDSKIHELIPSFEKLGNKGENSYVKIFDYHFKFDSFIISKQGKVEKIPKPKEYDIILLCFDYREDDSFNNIENFYKNNKYKEIFYGLTGFYYEINNKKVNIDTIKKFSKERDIKLYDIVLTSNFDKSFKKIIQDYHETKNNSSKTLSGLSKQKLYPTIEDNRYICKIGLIGSKSGKTTLSQTYKTGYFNANTTESSLINNVTKNITYKPDDKKQLAVPNETNDIKVKVELWDTPHVGINWENMNFVMMVAKSVDIIIYLYDNNNIDTFYDIREWDKKIHDNIVKNAIFCIVENQTDKKEFDDFIEERSKLASDIGAEKHFCIDASNKDSINDMIMDIVSFYLVKIDVVIEKPVEKKENVIKELNKNENKENVNENQQKINNENGQNDQSKKDKQTKEVKQTKKENNDNGGCSLF